MKIKTGVVIGVFVLGAYALHAYWTTYNMPAYEKLWGVIPTTRFIPLYERKVPTQQVLKIGVITDTQVHPNRVVRADKRPEAERYLGSSKDAHPLALFHENMRAFAPEIIIHVGDVIEGTNDEDYVGMWGLRLVRAELEKNNVPVYWAIGNHELRSVTKAQFKDALGLDALDYVLDIGDYRLVFVDANYYPDGREVVPGGKRHIPGHVHPDTLAWLREVLDTDKRTYVIMHQGAFDKAVSQGASADVESIIAQLQAQRDRTTSAAQRIALEKKIKKFEDARTRQKASVTNAPELRAILEQYNVEAFINGHLEVARYEEKNGVRYYSLTGTKKSRVFPESFYELIIDSGVPHVKMYYTDPLTGRQHTVEHFEDFARVVRDRDMRDN